MNAKDILWLGSLLCLAIFIWLRDISWMSETYDTLPVLSAIPLFAWLGSPWKYAESPAPYSRKLLVTAVLFCLAGIIVDLTLLLAVGWTLLLWCWASSKFANASEPSFKKLLVFPFMAFPWVSLDLQQLGWWFRLSGAWIAAALYRILGFNVLQEGTFVKINDLPISIEAACAGLNTLQSMLIAGSAVAYIMLKDTPYYWRNLPLLILFAWLANTLRIILLSAAALAVSPDFALGAFHTWGGWLIIIAMFAMCWLVFSIQENIYLKNASRRP